jgi:RNA polymerase sigma factor (sigma-70 family)
MRNFAGNKPPTDNSLMQLMALGVSPREMHNTSDFPQELKNINHAFIYDEYMYKKDCYIAYGVWKKWFKKFTELQPFKDDLIAQCLSKLWLFRRKYDEMKGATYETYAFTICRQIILKVIQTEKWQFENLRLRSLDEVIGQDENGNNITLFDFNSNATPEIPNNENKEFTDNVNRTTHFTIVNNLSTNRKKQIIDLGLQEYTLNEIAQMTKCNRSYVIKVNNEYRRKAKEIVKKQDN